MSPSSLLTALLLLSPGAGAAEEAVLDGGQYRSNVHTAAGRISSFSFSDRALSIDTPDGPLTLTVDRNTAIYREDHYGSPRDLTTGARVRASYGDGRLAYWVEVGGGDERPDGGNPTDEGGPPGPPSPTDGGPGGATAPAPPAEGASP